MLQLIRKELVRMQVLAARRAKGIVRVLGRIWHGEARKAQGRKIFRESGLLEPYSLEPLCGEGVAFRP